MYHDKVEETTKFSYNDYEHKIGKISITVSISNQLATYANAWTTCQLNIHKIYRKLSSTTKLHII